MEGEALVTCPLFHGLVAGNGYKEGPVGEGLAQGTGDGEPVHFREPDVRQHGVRLEALPDNLPGSPGRIGGPDFVAAGPDDNGQAVRCVLVVVHDQDTKGIR